MPVSVYAMSVTVKAFTVLCRMTWRLVECFDFNHISQSCLNFHVVEFLLKI